MLKFLSFLRNGWSERSGQEPGGWEEWRKLSDQEPISCVHRDSKVWGTLVRFLPSYLPALLTFTILSSHCAGRKEPSEMKGFSFYYHILFSSVYLAWWILGCHHLSFPTIWGSLIPTITRRRPGRDARPDRMEAGETSHLQRIPFRRLPSAVDSLGRTGSLRSLTQSHDRRKGVTVRRECGEWDKSAAVRQVVTEVKRVAAERTQQPVPSAHCMRLEWRKWQ